MKAWIESLIRPFEEPDAGAPPRRSAAFMRWLLRGAEPTVVGFIATATLLGIAEAFSAVAVGWVVDAAVTGEPATVLSEHGAMLIGLALFFVVFRPALMSLQSAFLSLSVNVGVVILAIWRLHRHTLGQSLSFFENDFAGRLSQKQLQTANAMQSVVAEGVNAVVYGLAAVGGALVVLGETHWALAAALAAWMAVYLRLIVYFLPRIRRAARARADARSHVSGQLVDTISHMETVKLFAHAGREEEAARDALLQFRERALVFGRTVWRFRTALTVLSSLLPILLIGGSLWLWQAGLASPGDIAAAGLLATRLSHMSGWISATAMSIFSEIGTIEDGMHTLSVPHELTDSDSATEPGRAQGRIVFQNVSFRYGRRKGGGLHGISLSIAPGEKLALVGRSGAGKSTAVALLTRLYEVEAGRILLDGRDIRDLTQDGLRRQIATITQDTAMFNRSARDNILYGRPDASEAEMREAARQAAADEFIAALRDHRGRTGYDAHLGERGVKLSGGQRQRIAIARAILKDAPVLVLDEATSALDSEVEATIQAQLAQLMEDKTVIAIAHRLSTLKRMDRIVVLDEGRIVEEGTHEALLEQGGLYAGLWARQSGGFIGLEAAE